MFYTSVQQKQGMSSTFIGVVPFCSDALHAKPLLAKCVPFAGSAIAVIRRHTDVLGAQISRRALRQASLRLFGMVFCFGELVVQ